MAERKPQLGDENFVPAAEENSVITYLRRI
jgi:hypothetical protein